MPAVSVIVPVHNAVQFLKTCLDSLHAQTYPRDSFEILVVDNNSTDGSDAVAAAYEGVRLLREPKQGAYSARNCGVAAASGEILAFTDPDCEANPRWLEKATGGLSGPAGIVLGDRRPASESRYLSLLADYEAEKGAWVAEQAVPEIYYGHTNNMAVRRFVFDRLGPFPERMRGGDTVFVRRAVDTFGCEVVRYVPEMVVRHLEIAGVRSYYKKRLVYGASNESLRAATPFRPLSGRERWRVFMATVRKRRYSLWRALQLLAVLVPGAFLYEWARRSAVPQSDQCSKARPV
jgi:glycosyltransferase involved in cell wall biosynthesis